MGDVPQHRLQGGIRRPQQRRCRGRRRPRVSPGQSSQSNSHHANRQIPRRGARRGSNQPAEWAASIRWPSSDLAMGKNGVSPTPRPPPLCPRCPRSQGPQPTAWRAPPAALTVEAAASKPDPSSPAGANQVDPRRPLHQRLRGEPAAPSGGDEGDGEEGKGRRRLGLGAARVTPAEATSGQLVPCLILSRDRKSVV